MDSGRSEAVVTCYLSGDYPASWRGLEIAIREKLEDFIGVLCIFATLIVLLLLSHGLEGLW